MHVSALKAPLFKLKTNKQTNKNTSLSFSALGNTLEGFEGKVGNSWDLGGAAEVAVVTLNQKVADKFLKVCVEWEGAHQGTQPLCPVSPLLPQEVGHGLPLFLHQWKKI